MRYGETGFNLEIDLSRGGIERVETDPEETALYLGGLGHQRQAVVGPGPARVTAFSPENLLIFSAGLLAARPPSAATAPS
jgi:benzoyl-CoA reductase subunit BamB